MKARKLEDVWYIEVDTKEFGKILLLEPQNKLPIPIKFKSEEEANGYIKEKQKNKIKHNY